MTEFSVNTRNRFALGLDDEEDTDLYELLEKEAEDKKQKAKEAEEAAKNRTATKGKKDKRNTVKSNTKKVPTKPVDNSSNQHTQQTSHDNTAAKKTYPPRNEENRPPRLRNNRPTGESSNVDNFEKPPRDLDNGRERRGGYGGNYRGRGARGGFGSRPRREFERHSGSDKTGVKAVEKKDGTGRHNWGDEIQSQLDQPADQQAEVNNEQIAASGEGDAAAEEATTPVDGEPTEAETEEKEKPVMTLDEYKAKNPKAKVVYGNLRKANEGTDTKQWKKTVALERKKKGDHSEDEYEEVTDDEVEDTKSDLQKLQIQITFGDRRGRGGRGGRGGFGRGGNRGGYGGSDSQEGGQRGGFEKRGRAKHHAPAVDNEKDFPMLGSR